MRHGDHECALDVLEEIFASPDDVWEIAMSTTCFPMDCSVARVQAQVIVDEAREAGWESAVHCAYMRVEASLARANVGDEDDDE